MGLIVRSSHIHAAGVYTNHPIKKGTHILEYTGPRITRAQADELYDHRDETYRCMEAKARSSEGKTPRMGVSLVISRTYLTRSVGEAIFSSQPAACAEV